MIEDDNNENIENNITEGNQPIINIDDIENAYKVDTERDYRQELLDKYENIEVDFTVDDSWLEDTDKIALIRFYNELVNKEYSKYPPIMGDILIKKFYYQTVSQMDKEEYKKEKEKDKNLSVVEKELLKIKDENSLEYALTKK